jgi:hypothetical protein
MDTPFNFLAGLPAPTNGLSLGEKLAQAILGRPWISSLLACLPSTVEPAILSTSLSRPPLSHTLLREAVANFRLPLSSPNVCLGPNDRVAVVLPTGPEVSPACGAPMHDKIDLLSYTERPCYPIYLHLSYMCANESQLHRPRAPR